jgi:hypothetical protein
MDSMSWHKPAQPTIPQTKLHKPRYSLWSQICTFLVCIAAYLLSTSIVGAASAQSFTPQQSAITQQSQRLLNVIEVATPVKITTPAGCTVKLMEYSFGFSYGKPFVGKNKCDVIAVWVLTVAQGHTHRLLVNTIELPLHLP